MIRKLTPEGLDYVLGHLREEDAAEIHATIDQGSLAATAQLILSIPGPQWQATLPTGEPAMVGGFCPMWPGIGSGWAFATNRFDDVVLEVTKVLKRSIFPALERSGVHRIEVRPMSGNNAVVRWLGLIGFVQEAVVAQFGQGREDFLLLARVTERDSSTKH